jgi:hypothetical protein
VQPASTGGRSAPALESFSTFESTACSCLRSLTVPASLVSTSAFFLSMPATPICVRASSRFFRISFSFALSLAGFYKWTS